MILSIGMIVKNEEKYLEQCLSAMKPLLDNVDSELIIADTGSTDCTVEIAKKFTDNVYHFEWINDFSAARNSTLQKAKGEWYMFIDADEILKNCDDIIRFFNSGEYKDYLSAAYIQRSYHNINNGEIDYSDFGDFRVLRLTKKLDHIKFENPIHEALTPYYSPVKYLDLIADHYGYMLYRDGKVTEEGMEKFKRNMAPLLQIVENLKPGERPDISVYKEISDCYLLSQDYETSLKYLDMGLQTLDRNKIAITTYFTEKAPTLLYLKRYEEVIECCSEYFSEKNPARKTALASDCTMYFYSASAYYFLNRYKEAVDDFVKFYDVYKLYSENKLNTNDLLYTSVSFSELKLKTALVFFFDSCVKEKLFDIAKKYEDPIPYLNFEDDWENILPFIKLKAEILRNTDYNGLLPLYKRLGENGRKQLICALRWHLYEADAEKRKTITEALRIISDSVSDKDKKTAEAIAICSNYFMQGSVDAAEIENYLKKYETAFNADMLCIMLDKSIDITAFVNSSDFMANECAFTVFSICSNAAALLESYDIKVVSAAGLEKTAEFYKYSMAQEIRLNIAVSGLFGKYGGIGARWQTEFAEFDAEKAPAEIKPAVMASYVVSAFEKGDYDLCLKELQKLLSVFPEFLPIVNAYRAETKKSDKRAKRENARSEFEQMAIAVKQNIREMIGAGNIADAESVLSEYELLCPDDSEIGVIRAEINALK
ncbi:MAG: glycosyltransferase [Ruminococcaceae bacterium]|nr:glycosyltransferase [Oscillospiraceae bacterium]